MFSCREDAARVLEAHAKEPLTLFGQLLSIKDADDALRDSSPFDQWQSLDERPMENLEYQ